MIFSVTANGTFMSTLSAGIVAIALPTMSSQFNVPLANIQLIVSLYLLVLTSLLPVFGKLSDMYSRKWMYLGGFITFGVGALGAALSNSLTTMLLTRAVQGIGSSAMMATSQALIAQVFHGSSRGKAFGAIGAVVACGSLAGPAIGGALIQAWGWRSIFWLTIPICILGVWRGIYLIPRFKGTPRLKMDYPGAIFFTLMSFCFLYALNTATARGWTSVPILSLFILSLFLFIGFIWREKTSSHPFVGLSIFKIPTISYGYVIAVLGFTSLFTNSVLLPFYLTDIMHLDPFSIGMLMLPFPLTLALASAWSGALCTRWPARVITTVGFSFLIISTLLFACIGPWAGAGYIVLAQLIMGLGSGLFQVPNNTTVISAAPKDKLGVVASINALARNVGTIGGIALSVAVCVAVQHYTQTCGYEPQHAFIAGYRAAMLLGTAFAVGGGILSLSRK